MKRAVQLFLDLVSAGFFFLFLFGAVSAAAEAPDDGFVSRTSKVEGVQLHYLTAGQGPVVILLHGYAETSRMWRPILPALAKHFQVIAPDLPGIGDSSIPADGLDMKSAAAVASRDKSVPTLSAIYRRIREAVESWSKVTKIHSSGARRTNSSISALVR